LNPECQLLGGELSFDLGIKMLQVIEKFLEVVDILVGQLVFRRERKFQGRRRDFYTRLQSADDHLDAFILNAGFAMGQDTLCVPLIRHRKRIGKSGVHGYKALAVIPNAHSGQDRFLIRDEILPCFELRFPVEKQSAKKMEPTGGIGRFRN
jgi:hypothetical protein